MMKTLICTKPQRALSRSLMGMRVLIASLLCFTASINCSAAARVSEEEKLAAREELEFGTVLFELYQRDYFKALINHAYISHKDNQGALSEHGQLLKGGMLLSYGVPERSHQLFTDLLDRSETEISRNSAWYYLSKLFYSKADMPKARDALSRVKGELPQELHIDYHYLSTLIGEEGNHLNDSRAALEKFKNELPEYPYFLFNFAIRSLKENDIETTISRLNGVISYAYLGEEYEVLADRAKHGLSQIASGQGQLHTAWQHLSAIRTTGLYSNRALLSYTWAAIKLKQYKEAIPALEILNSRSIALPEVQEAKVLLAHLYEQDGAKRNALKQNIIAEKEFRRGLEMLDRAREIIAMKDVPREFISNLEHVVRETDWYGDRPEVDYQSLTPFLIDLLASNTFNETLKELADLYALEQNLHYWKLQESQHLLVLNESKKKTYDEEKHNYVERGQELSVEFNIKDTELRLLLLALEDSDQTRFSTLLDSTQKEIDKFDNKIHLLSQVKVPYKAPKNYANDIKIQQSRIDEKLLRAQSYVKKLEVVVRKLVNLELDQHEERMRYYSAQARLAKARLYDATLMDLDSAKKRVQPSGQPKPEHRDAQ